MSTNLIDAQLIALVDGRTNVGLEPLDGAVVTHYASAQPPRVYLVEFHIERTPQGDRVDAVTGGWAGAHLRNEVREPHFVAWAFSPAEIMAATRVFERPLTLELLVEARALFNRADAPPRNTLT